MVKGQHPEASKVATKGILPAWLEAFRALLNTDPRRDVEGENWDGLAIRIEAFKVSALHVGRELHPAKLTRSRRCRLSSSSTWASRIH